MKKSIKKATRTSPVTWVIRPGAIVRLSDPEMKPAMQAAERKLSDKREALDFLQDIGVATPTGRLSKRFGG